MVRPPVVLREVVLEELVRALEGAAAEVEAVHRSRPPVPWQELRTAIPT
jgi:hypothetical protein